MKILLIQPPVRDFYQTRIRIQLIGLAYLAASLKENGYELAILPTLVLFLLFTIFTISVFPLAKLRKR